MMTPRLALTGALVAMPRRRRRLRRLKWRLEGIAVVFSLYGPLTPIALGLGLLAGSALALWRMGW